MRACDIFIRKWQRIRGRFVSNCRLKEETIVLLGRGRPKGGKKRGYFVERFGYAIAMTIAITA